VLLAFAGIRDHVVQAVELKFNCFFLMPVIDSFPTRLREELEQAYEEDLDEVFDVAAVRAALESRLHSLESELHQVRGMCEWLVAVTDMHTCVVWNARVRTSCDCCARAGACAGAQCTPLSPGCTSVPVFATYDCVQPLANTLKLRPFCPFAHHSQRLLSSVSLCCCWSIECLSTSDVMHQSFFVFCSKVTDFLLFL
jgi:hypothetical protein